MLIQSQLLRCGVTPQQGLEMIPNQILIHLMKSFSMILQTYKLFDSFEVQRSFKIFIRTLRRKNTEEGKIWYTEVEQSTWRDKQAHIEKMKKGNPIQNSKIQQESVSEYDAVQHATMMNSLKSLEMKIDEVVMLAEQVKNREKIEKVEDADLEDQFGQDVIKGSYKQGIIDRKTWTKDELLQQTKRYSEIDHRLTRLAISLQILIAQEKKGDVQEKKQKRKRLRKSAEQ